MLANACFVLPVYCHPAQKSERSIIMKVKSLVLYFLMSILLFDASAAGIKLKSKKSKETKVEPVSIEKISGIAEGENGESKDVKCTPIIGHFN